LQSVPNPRPRSPEFEHGIARVAGASPGAGGSDRMASRQWASPHSDAAATSGALPEMRDRVPIASGQTHRGMARDSNQDQFVIAELVRSVRVHASTDSALELFGRPSRQGWLFAVADGMGGHAAGEMASLVTLRTLVSFARSSLSWAADEPLGTSDKLAAGLLSAVQTCEESILLQATRERIAGAPGTTLTVAYVVWPNLYVAHAGDSRCYVQRDRQLFKVTDDHTFAASDGAGDDAKRHGDPMSHVLLNALGGGGDRVNPDLRFVPMQPGDTLFLCSDGVTCHLSSADIADLLQQVQDGNLTPDQCAQATIDLANKRGGQDNITVVIAHFPFEEAEQGPDASLRVEAR
jgi:serine/threonine protein phosphatase PrpC